MWRVACPWRLPWLAENTLAAIDALPQPADRQWRLRWSRAAVVLSGFLAHQPAASGGALDPIDQGIRSEKTQQLTWENASPISRRWGIVSALQVADFAQALREACAV